MANISSWLEEKILNHVLRGDSYTSPSTVYVGLVKNIAEDSDLEDGDLTDEITDYDGDRKEIIFTSPTQEDGKATIENDNQIDFDNMPSVTVGYAIVTDDVTPGNGNILYWCPPTNGAKSVNNGETYRLEIGDLVCDLD